MVFNLEIYILVGMIMDLFCVSFDEGDAIA